MKFKEFMDMYDNHNGITKVNDDNLNTIVKDETVIIMNSRPDLFDKEVVAFGFYDGELTVRLKTIAKFVWTDKEDPNLYHNGIRVMWVAGRSKSIQKFIEALSYKIGYKCDWSWFAGRAHIDIPKEACEKFIRLINDEESFFDQFIVPYSKESYYNETYFEIL